VNNSHYKFQTPLTYYIRFLRTGPFGSYSRFFRFLIIRPFPQSGENTISVKIKNKNWIALTTMGKKSSPGTVPTRTVENSPDGLGIYPRKNAGKMVNILGPVFSLARVGGGRRFGRKFGPGRKYRAIRHPARRGCHGGIRHFPRALFSSFWGLTGHRLPKRSSSDIRNVGTRPKTGGKEPFAFHAF